MSYSCADFVDTIDDMASKHSLPEADGGDYTDAGERGLASLANRIEFALNDRRDLLEAVQKAHAVMVDTHLDEYFDQGRIDEALDAMRKAIRAAGEKPRHQSDCAHDGDRVDGECMDCGEIVPP